jgi:hypothetical protein
LRSVARCTSTKIECVLDRNIRAEILGHINTTAFSAFLGAFLFVMFVIVVIIFLVIFVTLFIFEKLTLLGSRQIVIFHVIRHFRERRQ